MSERTDEILEAIRMEVGLASAPEVQNWRDRPETPTVADVLAAMRQDAMGAAIAFLREAVYYHDAQALAADVAEAVKAAKAELKAKQKAVKDADKAVDAAAKKLEAVEAEHAGVLRRYETGDMATLIHAGDDDAEYQLAKLQRGAARQKLKTAKGLAEHSRRAVEAQQALIERLTAFGERLAAMQPPAVPAWWGALVGK